MPSILVAINCCSVIRADLLFTVWYLGFGIYIGFFLSWFFFFDVENENKEIVHSQILLIILGRYCLSIVFEVVFQTPYMQTFLPSFTTYHLLFMNTGFKKMKTI